MTKRYDYSIDIETLGLATDACILSIGAVRFDIETGEIGEQPFYVKTFCDGRGFDIPTVRWWLDQDKDLIKHLFDGDKMDLVQALIALSSWINALEGDHYVWGNGATFDISILEDAYRKSVPKTDIPWKFWCIRDMRTIVDMATTIYGFDKKKIEFEGIQHNALDDAMHQAKVISAAYRTLTGDLSYIELGKFTEGCTPEPKGYKERINELTREGLFFTVYTDPKFKATTIELRDINNETVCVERYDIQTGKRLI